MLNKISKLPQLYRYFGPGWLAFRAGYALRTRSGLLRRQTTPFAWAERPLQSWLRADCPADPEAYRAWRAQHGGRFLFASLPEYPEGWDTQSVIVQAGELLAGRWRYFEHSVYEVGFPPDWLLNPLTGQRLPSGRHWSQISDFGQGDIKFVWEPNRFAAVYTLVRAYAASGGQDERYPAAFWTLIEDWAARNPPHLGPNWKCGQETAFRVMAWCFGLYAFARSAYTTAARIAHLAAMIAAQAERIERNIGYARSQRNNHAVSEGVGLWTVGLLFPEFARADRWRDLGHRVIEAEMRRQVYDDGSYAQHSLNYHRVMLHDCLWALRLGEQNAAPLSGTVYDRFGRAVDFLAELVDPESGEVPNYGGNDSALVLPLNGCEVTDFRPAIQAGGYLRTRKRLLPPGAWDEDLLWLFGPEALRSAHQPRERAVIYEAPVGGYYTLRDAESWLMVRCAEYRDRPHHADQLHVDLWWRGVNVACDAGSYLYNGQPPWHNGLTTTTVHNTVSIDGLDQMTRASVFLWLDWAEGKAKRTVSPERGEIIYWEGEHNGYRRLADPVTHRRGILRLGGDTWLILDALDGAAMHHYRLHWLLPDFPYTAQACRLTLNTPAGEFFVQAGEFAGHGDWSAMRGDESTGVRGWRSRYYGYKEPALSLALEARGRAIRFWTLFSPHQASIMISGDSLTVAGPDGEAQIRLAGGTGLVRAVELAGGDRLEVEQ